MVVVVVVNQGGGRGSSEQVDRWKTAPSFPYPPHSSCHPHSSYPPSPQTELKMTAGNSMDISEQSFLGLHQISRTPRGQMVHSDPGRHLFDTSMFRIVWGPAVHAMCTIVEQVRRYLPLSCTYLSRVALWL